MNALKAALRIRFRVDCASLSISRECFMSLPLLWYHTVPYYASGWRAYRSVEGHRRYGVDRGEAMSRANASQGTNASPNASQGIGAPVVRLRQVTKTYRIGAV